MINIKNKFLWKLDENCLNNINNKMKYLNNIILIEIKSKLYSAIYDVKLLPFITIIIMSITNIEKIIAILGGIKNITVEISKIFIILF